MKQKENREGLILKKKKKKKRKKSREATIQKRLICPKLSSNQKASSQK
jgi:hypothetical protein